MQYHNLGKTDIAVSAIAMGCWAIVGDFTWGPQDESDALATIHAALDAGVNFLDTAEGYGDGDSETLLGRALAGRRGEAVIASKVSQNHLAGVEVIAACERSLKRLRTDYIDLYQIHWPSRQVPFVETWEALTMLQAQGKVRAIGVSNFGAADLTDLLAIGTPETNQLPYSILWRAIEHDIQAACIEHGIGILTYSSLAQGLLTGKFATADEVPEGRARTRHFASTRPYVRHGEPSCEAETFAAIQAVRRISEEIREPMPRVAMAWLLRQPGVTSVIAGARNPDQIRSNAQAADLILPADVIAALNAVTDDLKQELGPNPDMWQSESRFR